MPIDTATPEELKRVSDYTVMQRALCSTLMKSMAQMNALINSWNADISTIIGTPNNRSVTDTSGLAGIAPLTDTDVYAITGYFQAILTGYYDTPHQQIFTRACGAPNAV